MATKKAKAKGSKAGKARTKSQVYGELAEYSDLSRKQARFDEAGFRAWLATRRAR